MRNDLHKDKILNSLLDEISEDILAEGATNENAQEWE